MVKQDVDFFLCTEFKLKYLKSDFGCQPKTTIYLKKKKTKTIMNQRISIIDF